MRTVLMTLLTVTAASLSLAGFQAYAIDPLTPNYDYAPMSPNQMQFSAVTQYFSSTANYDDQGGAFEQLDDEHSFSEINTRLRGSYDIAPVWRLTTGARINFVTSQDENEVRTNSELNEVSLGLVYAPVYTLSQRLYLEARGVLALNTIDPVAGDDAINGEAANQALIGARYGYLFSRFELLGSLHYQFLTEGRSARIPYSAGARLMFSDFSVFGSVFGFFSNTFDEFSDNPKERTDVTDRLNAGSLRYYAVDPSLLNSQISFDVALSKKANLMIGVTKTLNGLNAAEGIGIVAGLEFRWGGADINTNRTDIKRARAKRRRGGRVDPDSDFELKEERYDEGLFKPKPKKRKRRRRRRRPIDIDDAIDSTIDDLE
ncbi:MAG: hypothetical protein HRT45_02640 [Bdellovibrionales bacterium]|nr:hypothetical protein [Bdellovibrionales bacterium]